MRTPSFHILSLVAGLTVPALAQPRPALSPLTRQFVIEDAPVIALRHVRLIDGTGAPVRDNQTVVLTDGRITAVGDDALVTVPAGAKVLDLAGTTLIPGLYDLHAHQYFYSSAGLTQMAVSAPRLYLGGGITTVDLPRRLDRISVKKLPCESNLTSAEFQPFRSKAKSSSAACRAVITDLSDMTCSFYV